MSEEAPTTRDKIPWLSNRQRKRLPKQGKGWCGCDLAFIPHSMKCPVCGRINDRKRNKK